MTEALQDEQLIRITAQLLMEKEYCPSCFIHKVTCELDHNRMATKMWCDLCKWDDYVTDFERVVAPKAIDPYIAIVKRAWEKLRKDDGQLLHEG